MSAAPSDNAAALAGLIAERVDAFAGTALTVQDLMRKSNGNLLERAEPFNQPSLAGRSRSYGAFGFRKSDSDLVSAVNKELATFLGSREHRELVAPFGFTESELPGNATAEAICRNQE